MQQNLGDGLILRWSTSDDTEKLAEFVGWIFRSSADSQPHAELRDLVHRDMRGDYPFMGSEDFLLVEDTSKDGNPIVACTCYLAEEWCYDDIPFRVVQPEIVATHPDYRNRGLVRTMFEVIHERAAKDNRPVQGITGIPNFYRQFGYEYALDLGGRTILRIASLPAVDKPTCRLRPATVDDVPWITEIYREFHRDKLVFVNLAKSFWQYHIDAESQNDVSGEQLQGHLRIRIIEDTAGNPVGVLQTPHKPEGESIRISFLAFAPGAHVHALTPSLFRAIAELGEVLTTSEKAPKQLELLLGREHPLYRVLQPGWNPQFQEPYAWYIRVPDIPGFLRLIAPALERRLAKSEFAGHSGELRFDFFRGGMRMEFTDGRLDAIKDWRLEPFDREPKIGMPPLAFLRIIFGYSSLQDLMAAYPDVIVPGELRPLMETLFPKVLSTVALE